MSVTPKRFSDDELEWKAKKIKNVRIEHAKINQINLARKNQNHLSLSSKLSKAIQQKLSF